MELSFYKKNNSWFCDLPDYILQGGTEAECVMIAGSDLLLDFIYSDRRRVNIFPIDRVNIEIVSEDASSQHRIELLRIENTTKEFLEENNHPEVEYRGYYIVTKGKYLNHLLWICPIMIYLFGEYPASLNFNVL